jgi:hypothetical protein
MEASVATAVEFAGPGVASEQRICTAKGPMAIAELTSGGGVAAIGYDPAQRRYLQTTLKAKPGGQKPVVRVTTDKGPFTVACEQLVMLDDGRLVPALQLEPGDRLRACVTKERKLVEGEDDAFKFTGGNLLDLVSAECAVANWYPKPTVELTGPVPVCELEAAAPTGKDGAGALNTALLWIDNASGGVGIVIALA